jgi:transcriptional regulator with XRE-family HTH domain
MSTPNRHAIGNAIATLRKARGLTQVEVAAAIGWERTTLASVEPGADRPGLALLVALADSFAVSVDTILGRLSTAQPVSDRERELIELFRQASPDGQDGVLAVLRALTSEHRSR